MTAPIPPFSEDIQREIEQVRAVQAQQSVDPEPSVGKTLIKRGLRALLLWVILVGLFLVIWFVATPSE